MNALTEEQVKIREFGLNWNNAQRNKKPFAEELLEEISKSEKKREVKH